MEAGPTGEAPRASSEATLGAAPEGISLNSALTEPQRGPPRAKGYYPELLF